MRARSPDQAAQGCHGREHERLDRGSKGSARRPARSQEAVRIHNNPSQHADNSTQSSASDEFALRISGLCDHSAEERLALDGPVDKTDIASNIDGDDMSMDDGASERVDDGASEHPVDDDQSESASVASHEPSHNGHSKHGPLRGPSHRRQALRQQQLLKEAEAELKAQAQALSAEEKELAAQKKRIDVEDGKLRAKEEALGLAFRRHIHFPR